MKWLTNLLENLRQGQDYERLMEELGSCERGQRVLEKTIKGMQEELEEKDKELLLVYQDLEELEASIEQPEVDVLRAADSLHRVLSPNGPFTHYTKGRSNPSEDISAYCRYDRKNEIIRHFADSIEKEYEPQTPRDCVEAVMKWFIYKDRNNYAVDVGEDWKRPEEALRAIADNRTNDCEDLANAMHVLINELLIRTGNEEHRKRLLSFFSLTYAEPHMLNVWLHDDGYLYVVESTMDLKGTFKKKWLNTPLAFDSFYNKFYGLAYYQRSYRASNAITQRFK